MSATEFTEPLAMTFDTSSPHRYLRIAPQTIMRVESIYVDGTETKVEPTTISPGQECRFALPDGMREDAVVGAYVTSIEDTRAAPVRRQPVAGDIEPPRVEADVRVEPDTTVICSLNPCRRVTASPCARFKCFDLTIKGPVDDLVLMSFRIGANEQLLSQRVPAAMIAQIALSEIIPGGVLVTLTWKNLGRKKKPITISGGLVFESVDVKASPAPTSAPYSYPPTYGVAPNLGGRRH